MLTKFLVDSFVGGGEWKVSVDCFRYNSLKYMAEFQLLIGDKSLEMARLGRARRARDAGLQKGNSGKSLGRDF